MRQFSFARSIASSMLDPRPKPKVGALQARCAAFARGALVRRVTANKAATLKDIARCLIVESLSDTSISRAELTTTVRTRLLHLTHRELERFRPGETTAPTKPIRQLTSPDELLFDPDQNSNDVVARELAELWCLGPCDVLRSVNPQYDCGEWRRFTVGLSQYFSVVGQSH